MEAYLGILEDTEAELSTWRQDSQISRLNRQTVGAAFLLNEPLSRMFETLYFWHEQTDGAFDPGIGALTDVWGIHDGGRLPADSELRAAIERSGLRHFGFDAGSRRIVRRRDATIDVGGFGKGEALDRVLAYAQARDAAPFLIDLGGQILVHGLRPGRSDWEVSVAGPQHRQSAAISLRLKGGSLATSAGSERDVTAGGRRIGHIVDPRSGQTRVADYSLTVWHPSALAADVLSTALFVMGPDEGITWADRNGVAALFQTPAAKTSRAWREKCGRN
jgi:thiamine biosynthesis lipoprotein